MRTLYLPRPYCKKKKIVMVIVKLWIGRFKSLCTELFIILIYETRVYLKVKNNVQLFASKVMTNFIKISQISVHMRLKSTKGLCTVGKNTCL